MIIHHHINTTKVGRVEFYLNPEYIYSTQQMWVYKYRKDKEWVYDYWFFSRFCTIEEIGAYLKNLIDNV